MLAIIAACIAYKSLQQSVSKQINAARGLAEQQHKRQEELKRGEERRKCTAILIMVQVKLNSLGPHIQDWVSNLQEIQRASMNSESDLIYKAEAGGHWEVLERLRPIRAQAGLSVISLGELSVLDPSDQALLQGITFQIDTCDTLIEMARNMAKSRDTLHAILFAGEKELLVELYNKTPSVVNDIGERLKHHTS